MIKFNNEGIQKLSNLAENDATQVIDTFKVLVDLGKDYTSFAGKKENMEGNVIFIYKIQGITTKDA